MASLVVPAYLPDRCIPLIAWARTYAAKRAAQAHIDPQDVWDEAVTALCRAAAYFRPLPPKGRGAGRDGSAYSEAKAFKAYAQLAVSRGLWRYALPNLSTSNSPNSPPHTRRGIRHNHHHLDHDSLEYLVTESVHFSPADAGAYFGTPSPTPDPLTYPSAETIALAHEAATLFTPQPELSRAKPRARTA